MLEGIEKILSEKGQELSNQEFFMFVSQVNRAMAIATESIDSNLDNILKLSEEILRRLKDETPPTELDVVG